MPRCRAYSRNHTGGEPMSPFNDKPIKRPDRPDAKTGIGNSKNQETAQLFGAAALLHHWRMLNLFLELLRRKDYVVKVSCGIIEETQEIAKIGSMNGLCMEICFHYSIIIEECIKIIFSFEKKFLKLNNEEERVFNNNELSDTSNLNIDKRYGHKIHEYFNELTSETQEFIRTEYERIVSNIRHDIKCDKIEIANFDRSLNLNEDIIKNIKYNLELPEKSLPCGIIFDKDQGRICGISDHEHNFAYFLLKFIYEGHLINILQEKYSV